MIPNHYRVLGIKASAQPEDIKSAYRRRARETHTDTGGNRTEFERVTEAYQVLSDPARRREWEREYLRQALAVGHFVCASCFTVNRVRSLRPGETAKCAACKAVLDVTPEGREARYKAALREQVGDLVLTIGAEAGSLAKDAVVAGADALRRRLRLQRGE